jgi:hypothetical protein
VNDRAAARALEYIAAQLDRLRMETRLEKFGVHHLGAPEFAG